MISDERFLEISFNHVFREITGSLEMDFEDIIVFFKKRKVEIEPNTITEWERDTLPGIGQFMILSEYIDEKTREFNDIERLCSTANKLKEYINWHTLIRMLDKVKLISIREPATLLKGVLNKAYDYHIYNNTPQQQIENLIDFIGTRRRYRPKVFISYSWDSPQHSERVFLFTACLKEANLTVLLDLDLHFGRQIDGFMNNIMDCDYVLVICTPQYKEKADKYLGGVGYENKIITQELVRAENEYKFIPVLFAGDWETSLPDWAKNRKGVDLRPSEDTSDEVRKLINQLCALALTEDQCEILYANCQKNSNFHHDY